MARHAGIAQVPEAIGAIVSPAAADRLERYVALLTKWQASHNLIGGRTLDQVWTRHIADCAQLVLLRPRARRWVDLGSGAGLPGLVIAMLLADQVGAHVHLIESDQRKCAFLRAAIRETGVTATVHDGRIDSVLQRWTEPVDCVTARALAPLPELLTLAAPLIRQGAIGLFLKGQDLDVEYQAAARYWILDSVKHVNLVESSGFILEVRGLLPNTAE